MHEINANTMQGQQENISMPRGKDRKFISMQNLVHNEKSLTNARRVAIVFGGCIAGILGLQSVSVRLSFKNIAHRICGRVLIFV